MSNSLKNDLQLLKELQDLNFQIIDSEKNIKNVQNIIKFLNAKILACDNINTEIHKINVEDKVSFSNIKMIVQKNNLNSEDFLDEGDNTSVCISKIENFKEKFIQKNQEQEDLLKKIEEDHKFMAKDIGNKKNAIVSILKPNILKIYDRLFNLFEDKIVLATIEDNICSRCNIKNCLQRSIDVMKYENIIYCENCGRIFFY